MITMMPLTSQVLAGARPVTGAGISGVFTTGRWPIAHPTTTGFAAEFAKHGEANGTTVRLLRTRST